MPANSRVSRRGGRAELAVDAVAAEVFDERRKRIAARTRGLISPQRIIDCVQAATTRDLEDGFRIEREAFLECRESPQSDGLRHAFFAERKVGNVPELDRDTPTRRIGSIAIVGAGTMGVGIAHCCLSAGCNVLLLDKAADGVQRGAQAVRDLFAEGVRRGKVREDAAEAALSRLAAGTDLDALADVDLVIEAVFEDLAIKKNIFARLGRICQHGAVLATNTSTLDVDAIAAASQRPADVIGLHFFSPAHLMRLLEIVRGRETSQEVLATALALAKMLGKTGVVVGNCFGFVGNRMLYSYGRENQLLLLEGAPPQQVDRALYDWGMAMGPNAVGDLAGLDVGYKARQQRIDRPDDPRFYRIADLLVENGRLGRKTGRGMYRYDGEDGTPQPDPEVQQLIDEEAARLGISRREIDDREIVERCIYGLVTEGARILEEGIATRASDIDVIWINGYGFPRHRGGPMHWTRTGSAWPTSITRCANLPSVSANATGSHRRCWSGWRKTADDSTISATDRARLIHERSTSAEAKACPGRAFQGRCEHVRVRAPGSTSCSHGPEKPSPGHTSASCLRAVQ
ncbi:MAG: 3-hydroxyacyl-CoA dehydrogenase NAD-binding domain-containing protein [Woeseiaceae bacterium]|nr:3-hydroxyacyl-CoA dehydrogenase NAD-binding domain-containing protein [Woeseiaceae bacterium]